METEHVSNKFEEHKNQWNKDIQVTELTDMISRLELNNKSVNLSKVSGIALAIKSKLTHEDPNSKKMEKSINHK